MYGIIAEDNSDIECLKILIKRLAKNDSLKIKHKGYKGCANMLRDGWKELKSYSELSYISHFIFHTFKVKTPVFRRADFISNPKSVSIIKIFGKVKKWIIDMVAIRHSKSNTILFG
jgi:hypothetical protein